MLSTDPGMGPPRSVLEQLLALHEEQAAELIDGRLVEKASPSALHAQAQGGLLAVLRPAFHRRTGGAAPGGWWLLPEVEVEIEPGQVYRPDLAGWRRERMTELYELLRPKANSDAAEEA